MRLKDMAMWIYKKAAGYNRKWHCSIRRPRKPHPITKHGVNRTTRRRDMAIWSFSKWPPAGRHLGFDPTGNGAVRSAVPENPTLEPNMMGIGGRVAELWPFEVFQYVWMGPEVGRSSVAGRQYSYFLHWSHILRFCYVRNIAREE